MISYKKSLSILNKNKIKISNESVISENSLNRVSAENVYSKYNYPSVNNSAFDGYAIKSSETNKASKNKKIKLVRLIDIFFYTHKKGMSISLTFIEGKNCIDSSDNISTQADSNSPSQCHSQTTLAVGNPADKKEKTNIYIK